MGGGDVTYQRNDQEPHEARSRRDDDGVLKTYDVAQAQQGSARIEAKVYGVICFGMGLTLREGNREYFYKQLCRLFPQLTETYLQTYGNQSILESPDNDRLMELFYKKCSKNKIAHDNEKIFQYLHTFTEKEAFKQLSLWDLPSVNVSCPVSYSD